MVKSCFGGRVRFESTSELGDVRPVQNRSNPQRNHYAQTVGGDVNVKFWEILKTLLGSDAQKITFF